MADEVDQVSGSGLPSEREAAARLSPLRPGPRSRRLPPSLRGPWANLRGWRGRETEAGLGLPRWGRAYLPAEPPPGSGSRPEAQPPAGSALRVRYTERYNAAAGVVGSAGRARLRPVFPGNRRRRRAAEGNILGRASLRRK